MNDGKNVYMYFALKNYDFSQKTSIDRKIFTYDQEMSPKTKDGKQLQQQEQQKSLQEELFPAAEWAWLDQLIEDMADGGDETRRLPPIDEHIHFKIPVIKRQPSAKVLNSFRLSVCLSICLSVCLSVYLYDGFYAFSCLTSHCLLSSFLSIKLSFDES